MKRKNETFLLAIISETVPKVTGNIYSYLYLVQRLSNFLQSYLCFVFIVI